MLLVHFNFAPYIHESYFTIILFHSTVTRVYKLVFHFLILVTWSYLRIKKVCNISSLFTYKAFQCNYILHKQIWITLRTRVDHYQSLVNGMWMIQLQLKVTRWFSTKLEMRKRQVANLTHLQRLIILVQDLR